MKALPIAALLATAALAGCGSSGGGYSSSSNASAGAAPLAAAGTLSASSTSIGTVLVDGSGRTLYTFARDSGGKSNCNGACAQNWPPAKASGALKAGSGVTKSKLSAIRRSDGTMQVAFAGHPLYRFSGDSGAGDVTGQAQRAFGGLWLAITPAGQGATGKASSGGGGGSPGGY
jgi:predicted lipoprotein with Yx(FWY)xxD motif